MNCSGNNSLILRRDSLIVLLVFCMSLTEPLSGIGSAQDQKNPPSAENPDSELNPEEKNALKERDVKIGFILLGGVIFIGGFTIFMVMLWGYRVRRVIREPLAPCEQIDPLWYLKSKNPVPESEEDIQENKNSDQNEKPPEDPPDNQE